MSEFKECRICGYPGTPESAETCAACYPRWRAYCEEEKREAEQAKLLAEREEKDREQNLEFFVRPHFGDLTPELRKLFRILADYSSFSVGNVSQLMGIAPLRAWEKLKELMSHGVIVELIQPYGTVRQFGEFSPYEAKASPNSNYRVRRSALQQMWDSDSINPTVTSEPISQSVEADLVKAVLPSSAERWIEAALSDSPAHSVSLIEACGSYSRWAAKESAEQLGADEIAQAISAKYPIEEGRVRGVRLTRSKQV